MFLTPYRRFVTSSVAFTFAVVGGTGVFFKFFFKTGYLEKLHSWLGIALVIAALCHVRQNWTALRSYLRDWRVWFLLVPIVLAAIFIWVDPSAEDGGPKPRAVVNAIVHARTSALAAAFGKNLEMVLTAMRRDGLRIESGETTLETLGRENHRPPESLLRYFMP